tara:strand:- start:1684 stop:1848 length:165 start_codon:yes stop_codon:yes gene_type:complete
MTNKRFKELQLEIAGLKEIDKKITERVAAELNAEDCNNIVKTEQIINDNRNTNE